MKPIIMSTEDVRGILDGRKAMARRVVKPQPTHWDDGERIYDKDSIVGPEFYAPVRVDKNGEQYPGKEVYGIYSDDGEYGCKAPCQPGDVLYVRETWGDYGGCTGYYVYRADYPHDAKGYWYEKEHINWCDLPDWHSPVTMPREASRLFLRVTDVRVERVQDISPEDCESEGYFEAEPVEPRPRSWFSAVWDARNAKRGYGWDSNPFVWVIEFERIEKGEES